jgi:folylpolyglutamate synthase
VIGLYTSPHMVAVRERIRIDGAPLPEDEFAGYFFEIWDKLIANDTVCYFARARGICLRDHL